VNGDLRPPDDAVDAVSGADRTDPIATSSATSRSKRARLRAYRTRRRTKKALRSKVRRRLTRAAITVSCVLLLIVGGSVGYAMYRFGQITYIPSGPAVHPAPPGEPENILLIGSTDRCAATKLKVFAKECAESPSGINSDVVMIVRLVPKDHRVTLLSIPRDTFIPDARSGKPTGGYGGIDGLYNRIDAALLDGPAQLAAAIMQDFGIPINHFVELNFATFTNVVNVLGGIYMYFPDRVYDASSPPLEITRRGCNNRTATDRSRSSARATSTTSPRERRSTSRPSRKPRRISSTTRRTPVVLTTAPATSGVSPACTSSSRSSRLPSRSADSATSLRTTR